MSKNQEIGRIYRRVAEKYVNYAQRSHLPGAEVEVATFSQYEYVKLEKILRIEYRIRRILEVFTKFVGAGVEIDLEKLREGILHHSQDGMVLTDTLTELVDFQEVVMAMIETWHDECVRNMPIFHFMNHPEANYLWLPFMLTGEQHAGECFDMIEPVLDGLGVTVAKTRIMEYYQTESRRFVMQKFGGSKWNLKMNLARMDELYEAWPCGLNVVLGGSAGEQIDRMVEEIC